MNTAAAATTTTATATATTATTTTARRVSTLAEAARLLALLVRHGLKTLAFVKVSLTLPSYHPYTHGLKTLAFVKVRYLVITLIHHGPKTLAFLKVRYLVITP